MKYIIAALFLGILLSVPLFMYSTYLFRHNANPLPAMLLMIGALITGILAGVGVVVAMNE